MENTFHFMGYLWSNDSCCLELCVEQDSETICIDWKRVLIPINVCDRCGWQGLWDGVVMYPMFLPLVSVTIPSGRSAPLADSVKGRFKDCVLTANNLTLSRWFHLFVHRSPPPPPMKFLYWMICDDPLNSKILWLMNSQVINALLWRTKGCFLVWVPSEENLRQDSSANDLNREVKDTDGVFSNPLPLISLGKLRVRPTWKARLLGWFYRNSYQSLDEDLRGGGGRAR